MVLIATAAVAFAQSAAPSFSQSGTSVPSVRLPSTPDYRGPQQRASGIAKIAVFWAGLYQDRQTLRKIREASIAEIEARKVKITDGEVHVLWVTLHQYGLGRRIISVNHLAHGESRWEALIEAFAGKNVLTTTSMSEKADIKIFAFANSVDGKINVSPALTLTMDRIEMAAIAGQKLRSERGRSRGLSKQVDELEERNKALSSELQRKASNESSDRMREWIQRDARMHAEADMRQRERDNSLAALRRSDDERRSASDRSYQEFQSYQDAAIPTYIPPSSVYVPIFREDFKFYQNTPPEQQPPIDLTKP